MIFDNPIGLRIGYVLDLLLLLIRFEKPKHRKQRS